jgi:hypothetical protein
MPGGPAQPEPDLPARTEKRFYVITKALPSGHCEVFVITGIRGLTGTAALRVGLRVRKRSGMRVLGAAATNRCRQAPSRQAIPTPASPTTPSATPSTHFAAAFHPFGQSLGCQSRNVAP